MKTTFIYALCEPGTRTVRYIGKANSPPARFKQHLRPSGSIKGQTPLGEWFRSLKERSAIPSLVLLREVLVEEWEIEEAQYIKAARLLGMNLVNSTDGGEGVQNPAPEIRQKLSARKLGSLNPMFGVHLNGRLNPMFGRSGNKSPQFGLKRSPGTLAKLRGQKRPRGKGQKASPEALINMRLAQTARWSRHQVKKLPCFFGGEGI